MASHTPAAPAGTFQRPTKIKFSLELIDTENARQNATVLRTLKKPGLLTCFSYIDFLRDLPILVDGNRGGEGKEMYIFVGRHRRRITTALDWDYECWTHVENLPFHIVVQFQAPNRLPPRGDDEDTFACVSEEEMNPCDVVAQSVKRRFEELEEVEGELGGNDDVQTVVMMEEEEEEEMGNLSHQPSVDWEMIEHFDLSDSAPEEEENGSVESTSQCAVEQQILAEVAPEELARAEPQQHQLKYESEVEQESEDEVEQETDEERQQSSVFEVEQQNEQQSEAEAEQESQAELDLEQDSETEQQHEHESESETEQQHENESESEAEQQDEQMYEQAQLEHKLEKLALDAPQTSSTNDQIDDSLQRAADTPLPHFDWSDAMAHTASHEQEDSLNALLERDAEIARKLQEEEQALLYARIAALSSDMKAAQMLARELVRGDVLAMEADARFAREMQDEEEELGALQQLREESDEGDAVIARAMYEQELAECARLQAANTALFEEQDESIARELQREEELANNPEVDWELAHALLQEEFNEE